MTKPKIWIELLFRVNAWRDFDDLRASDYKVMGGPLPGAEFPTVSCAFTMFREIPEGLEEYFERPMRSLDVLQLVSFWAQTKAIRTIPLLVISRSDVFRLGLDKQKIGWQEVSGSPDYVATCVPGAFNQIKKEDIWRSRLKSKV